MRMEDVIHPASGTVNRHGKPHASCMIYSDRFSSVTWLTDNSRDSYRVFGSGDQLVIWTTDKQNDYADIASFIVEISTV